MVLLDRVFVAGAVLGLGCAALGCSSTTSIRPDQLPILTDAASRGREAPPVIDAYGQMVRVGGALDTVDITIGPPSDEVKTFHAPIDAQVGAPPVASEVRGPVLSVSDSVSVASMPLSSIQGVKVTYEDKEAKLSAGVVLDVLGGACLVGGSALLIGGIWADTHGGSSEVGVGSFLAFFVGLPVLLVAAPAFLIPGIVLTKSGAQKPKYSRSSVSRVRAGPGGVRVSF